jgi:selenocysteine-specific elongation factor
MASIVIGTAGHVDHGKSTLVRALTGTDPDRPGVDRVTADRADRVDRLKEEQRRGITIDLGFASTRIGDLEVAFVDVPGHERFVRNMLAGAGAFDAVLLVVAADESVMPQTREHLAICRLLGVERGVVALTKADRVDEDTHALVELEIRELVAGTFLAAAPVVPVSAKSGAGLDALRSALAALSPRASADLERAPVRLSVDRAFSAKGFGTVVTGTLVAGAVGEGDELELLPAHQRTRVRGLHVHGQSVTRAVSPRRVALNLGHVSVDDVPRGVTVSAPETLAATRRLDAAIELLPSASGLRHGARVHVHLGTSDIGARVAVSAVQGSADEAWRPATVGEASVAVPSGGRAFVRLRLDQPVAATRGDRLVLRASSPQTTIGGGRILDPEPPARGLRRAAALARFLALESTETACAVMVAEAALRGFTLSAAVRRLGLGQDAVAALATRLVGSGHAVRVTPDDPRMFDARLVAAGESAILAALKAAPVAADGARGLTRDALRERAVRGADPAWLDYLLGRLRARAAIDGVERIDLAADKPAVDAKLVAVARVIDDHFRAAGLMPPDTAAVAATQKLPAPLVDRAVRSLVRDRRLVRLGDLYFHPEALASLRSDIVSRGVRARESGGTATLDVASFKTTHGLSRKFAIPLLEWLDRERVTRRVGDTRVVL